MNLKNMVILVSVIQTDEGVQSSLPKEQNSTTTTLPRKDHSGKHNYKEHFSESQFNFVYDFIKIF